MEKHNFTGNVCGTAASLMLAARHQRVSNERALTRKLQPKLTYKTTRLPFQSIRRFLLLSHWPVCLPLWLLDHSLLLSPPAKQ